MEPVTSTALAIIVVNYLGKKLKESKSINDFFGDFSEATVNWIKPIFIKGGKPKEVLENLQNDPDDKLNRQDATTAIERGLRQNSDAFELLQQMVAVIKQKDTANIETNEISVSGNNNKSYQSMDNSSIVDSSVNQSHSGNGDNIGRDKITNL